MQHRARKRFGQNFLRDPMVIQKIITAIAPQKGQHLVEIGPGQGAITEPLLEAIKQLDVIELDRDLIPILQKKFTQFSGLNIHQADALGFDFRTLVHNDQRLRIVGNLPYNISTPLIFHLLEQINIIQDMHFMLQKEVVNRMASAPGSKSYGRLSVMIQYHCQVQALFNVPPTSFTPTPKVDSAIVRLVPHKVPPVEVDDKSMFKQVVTQSFGQRRKTLRNNLKTVLSAQQIEALGINPRLRPEVLTLQQYAQLSNAVSALESAQK
ncbi:MAG: 16S rRNA (adenine(1518)-N(6)/adenine(1519)-N(6))-dimethyltransferase RsmA [Gammaproteobacteria bacterium]|nr:16S rRNA (adenine(1518)-N(6)/adenine(1519)-N(6))-dimethyltransferase RsmA [Gammaproteobacteria bacterium]